MAGDYYKDGEAGIATANAVIDAGIIAIDGIAPYADVIGLKGLAMTGTVPRLLQTESASLSRPWTSSSPS